MSDDSHDHGKLWSIPTLTEAQRHRLDRLVKQHGGDICEQCGRIGLRFLGADFFANALKLVCLYCHHRQVYAIGSPETWEEVDTPEYRYIVMTTFHGAFRDVFYTDDFSAAERVRDQLVEQSTDEFPNYFIFDTVKGAGDPPPRQASVPVDLRAEYDYFAQFAGDEPDVFGDI